MGSIPVSRIMTGHGALFALVTLVLWVIISYIVFESAEARGYNPWLWAIVVFIFGLFGLLAYAIRLLVD